MSKNPENPSYFSDDENDNESGDDGTASVDDGSEIEEIEAEVEEDEEEEEDAKKEKMSGEEEEGEEEKEDDTPNMMDVGDEEDEDESDEEDDNYLQKFDEEVNKNYILDVHPECATHNKTEISAMTQVVRDVNGNIIDDLHRTLPFLTKYERARILGQRASQINAGAPAFIANIPANVLDGHLIAEMELDLKSIPYIIRRPLPNGGSEYWRVKDLQNILT